jgi:hypothetical protein
VRSQATEGGEAVNMFVGGTRHAKDVDVREDGELPERYGDPAGKGFYVRRECEFIQNNEITQRPQWRYVLQVYVHSDIMTSSAPDMNTYQLLADAVMRQYFVAHGDKTKVTGLLKPVESAIGGNGAGVPPHQEPPSSVEPTAQQVIGHVVYCKACADAESSGEAYEPQPDPFESPRDAAAWAYRHNESTGHVLTMTTAKR